MFPMNTSDAIDNLSRHDLLELVVELQHQVSSICERDCAICCQQFDLYAPRVAHSTSPISPLR
jgi:hypothetical protein